MASPVFGRSLHGLYGPILMTTAIYVLSAAIVFHAVTNCVRSYYWYMKDKRKNLWREKLYR